MSLPSALSHRPDASEDRASLSASQTEAPLSDAQTLVQSIVEGEVFFLKP